MLIESGLTDSFNALMDTRNYLLTMGNVLKREETEELLKKYER